MSPDNRRTTPFARQFFGNTQKHSLEDHEDRFLLFGAIIDDDEAVAITRHDLAGLMDSVQQVATVASQTGLVIRILDTRAVLPLKIAKAASNSANFIQLYNVASDGTETVIAGGAVNSGAWTDPSSKELKENFKDLTETQIKNLLEKLKIQRYNYISAPEAVFVGPTAEDFVQMTGFGYEDSISPLTMGSIALRLVQWVWKKVVGMEKRLKAIETKLADDAPTV